MPRFGSHFIFSTLSLATFIFSTKIDLCLGYDFMLYEKKSFNDK
jgi:hypothetical protein